MWGKHMECSPHCQSLTAPALPITRSSGRTTAWTFAPSPVMERYCDLPPRLLHPPLFPTYDQLC